jgi:hypothetical protein
MAWRKWFVRISVFSIAAGVAAIAFAYQHWTNPASVRREVIARLSEHLPGAEVGVESAQFRLLGGISFSELRFRRKGDATDSEFAYVPSGIIYHDKEQLRTGTMAIRQINWHHPRLRVIRRKDGSWNLAGVLGKVNLELSIPTIVLQHATFVFEDQCDAAQLPPLEIKDVDLTIVNDPKDTLAFEGTGTAAVFGAFQLTGTLGRRDNDLTLALRLPHVSAGGDLVERLRAYCSQAEHARQLTGAAEMRVDLSYHPQLTPSWHHEVRCHLTQGKLVHAELPLPLDNLEINAWCIDGQVTLEKLDATSGVAEVHAHGKALRPTPDADLEGELRIDRLPLNKELFERLPGDLRDIGTDFSPKGAMNLAMHVRRAAGHWMSKCTMYPQDTSAVFAKFPYPLEHITGEIDYEGGSEKSSDRVVVKLIGYSGTRPVHIQGTMGIADEGKGDLRSELRAGSGDPRPAQSEPRARSGEPRPAQGEPRPAQGEPRPARPHESRPLQKPPLDFHVWGENIPLDARLDAALVEERESQTIARAFHPQGLADIRAHIRREAGHSKCSNEIIIRFHDASMRYDVFPYPVENVSGTLNIQPDHWEIHDFQGTHKGAEFRAQGGTVPTADGKRLSIDISGTNAVLDEEMEAALRQPGLRSAWTKLSPAGQINFETHVEQAGAGDEPDIAVTVIPLGCRIRPDFFKYELSDLRGTVRYQQHQVQLVKLTARHGTGQLSIDTGQVYLKEHDDVFVNLTDLIANPLTVDEDFLNALPPALRSACESLHLQSRLSLRSNITVDVPGTQDPPYVYWDGGIRLQDAMLNVGVPADHVTGVISCRGKYQGKFGDVRGNIELEETRIFHQPVSHIHSQILVSEKEPETLILPNLKARVFDGDVGGIVRVDFGREPHYELNLAASQMKLEQFARTNELGPRAQMSGLAAARLYLKGQGADVNTLEGAGSVDVPNGKMYNLPVLLDLIKVLNLRFPDKTAFEEARIRFTVRGPRVEISRLDLFGNAISLGGQGSMTVYGTDLNIDFYAVWARVMQWSPEAIEKVWPWLSQNLLKIKVRGQIGNVQATKEPVPLLVDPVKQLLRRIGGTQLTNDEARMTNPVVQ